MKIHPYFLNIYDYYSYFFIFDFIRLLKKHKLKLFDD